MPRSLSGAGVVGCVRIVMRGVYCARRLHRVLYSIGYCTWSEVVLSILCNFLHLQRFCAAGWYCALRHPCEGNAA